MSVLATEQRLGRSARLAPGPRVRARGAHGRAWCKVHVIVRIATVIILDARVQPAPEADQEREAPDAVLPRVRVPVERDAERPGAAGLVPRDRRAVRSERRVRVRRVKGVAEHREVADARERQGRRADLLEATRRGHAALTWIFRVIVPVVVHRRPQGGRIGGHCGVACARGAVACARGAVDRGAGGRRGGAPVARRCTAQRSLPRARGECASASDVRREQSGSLSTTSAHPGLHGLSQSRGGPWSRPRS